MSPFTRIPAEAAAALGEKRLIVEIKRWLGKTSPPAPFGIGDDCAVVPSSGRAMLITTDPVIYGLHFDDSVPARAVGAKLLKRNLSDIAAMGGRPVAAVVSLALAANTSVAWLHEFYLGLAATARKYKVSIVGGDITQSPTGFLGAFLTLHGEAAGKRIISRSGAMPGDRIYVTGTLGGSLLGGHYRFTPRLVEGTWLAQRQEVCAMMDVSDGLAKDLHSLTPAGLTPAMRESAVPISAAARRCAMQTKQTPLFHALGDGEDYELLIVVCYRADCTKFEQAWQRRFPRLRLTQLGTFVRRDQLPEGAIQLANFSGYEHLKLD
ncbi:MAG: thiamine-phosphate kinase [Candidatus Didemnitutus sp.]|nr:thiamine-phosphate kinase [Candidatus Didemnitutus sp.]